MTVFKCYLSIMAFSLETCSLFEAAYVSVLMIVFIVLAFVCQRKTWLWCGLTMLFVVGIAFVAVPAHMLKFEVLDCI